VNDNDGTVLNWWVNLNTEDRQAFADRTRTTLSYLQAGLFRRNPQHRKQPSADLMADLVKASDGALTELDLVKFFYLERMLHNREGVAA